MNTIDVHDNISLCLALPLRRVATFTGSALPLRIVGIPAKFATHAVTGVTLTLTNADGTSMAVPCDRSEDGAWTALIAPSFFAAYGFISRGVKVVANVADGNQTRSVAVGVGDLDIVADSAEVRRGDPDKTVQGKGDDIYIKTSIVDGAQHYTKMEMAYDARVGWGATWSGDYVLVDGEFQEAN